MQSIKFIDIKKIVAQLSISHLSTTEQQAAIVKLEEEISDRINLAIIEKLSEEEREEFLAIVEIGNNQEIINYIQSKIPDFQTLIQDISTQSVEEFISM
jgi:hypothetical protein